MSAFGGRLSSAVRTFRAVIIENQELLRNVLAKVLEMNWEFDVLGGLADGISGRRFCFEVHPGPYCDRYRYAGVGRDLDGRIALGIDSGSLHLDVPLLKDPFCDQVVCVKSGFMATTWERIRPWISSRRRMRNVASGKCYCAVLVQKVSSELAQNPVIFPRY